VSKRADCDAGSEPPGRRVIKGEVLMAEDAAGVKAAVPQRNKADSLRLIGGVRFPLRYHLVRSEVWLAVSANGFSGS
jgi:hypothetical protein